MHQLHFDGWPKVNEAREQPKEDFCNLSDFKGGQCVLVTHGEGRTHESQAQARRCRGARAVSCHPAHTQALPPHLQMVFSATVEPVTQLLLRADGGKRGGCGERGGKKVG